MVIELTISICFNCTCCHEAIVKRRSPTARSLSLEERLHSTHHHYSSGGAWPDFFFKSLTALFAVVPKLFAFDLTKALQVGQALISGRLQSRWSAHSLEKCAIMDCHGCTPTYHICCVNGNMRYTNYIYCILYINLKTTCEASLHTIVANEDQSLLVYYKPNTHIFGFGVLFTDEKPSDRTQLLTTLLPNKFGSCHLIVCLFCPQAFGNNTA